MDGRAGLTPPASRIAASIVFDKFPGLLNKDAFLETLSTIRSPARRLRHSGFKLSNIFHKVSAVAR